MATRLELDAKLRAVLGSDHCYFQPPENLKLQYDCIVYRFAGADVKRADNTIHHMTRKYEVTVIYRNPDSDYLTPMLKTFPYCRPEPPYTADNLNHLVFTIYY